MTPGNRPSHWLSEGRKHLGLCTSIQEIRGAQIGTSTSQFKPTCLFPLKSNAYHIYLNIGWRYPDNIDIKSATTVDTTLGDTDMFTRKEDEGIVCLDPLGDQTDNAIRVGEYYSGVSFRSHDTELSIDDFLNGVFDDDIKFLADAIDDNLFGVNQDGQVEQVSTFQALCSVCDSYGLLLVT